MDEPSGDLAKLSGASLDHSLAVPAEADQVDQILRRKRKPRDGQKAC
jgi:hypothetical protein